ncbi:MAG: hypothetical protein DMG57_31740 [Acidobacteria bacterium]|nr:MAG: hypothetical protein DMG57_31740 [Acidobacteriota bacterium]
MLTIYRRHVKDCEHGGEGRKYRRCRCPIWVDGFLKGAEIRKALEVRDWEKAQQTIREWESRGQMEPVDPLPEEVSLERACQDFLSDAKARELRESTLKKYRFLFKQLRSFSADQGLLYIKQFDLLMLRRFRESWADSGISALKKLERLRAFLRFALESGWVEENFAKMLKNPKVNDPPTLPYTQAEMIDILAACEEYSGDK